MFKFLCLYHLLTLTVREEDYFRNTLCCVYGKLDIYVFISFLSMFNCVGWIPYISVVHPSLLTTIKAVIVVCICFVDKKNLFMVNSPYGTSSFGCWKGLSRHKPQGYKGAPADDRDDLYSQINHMEFNNRTLDPNYTLHFLICNIIKCR